MKTNPHRFEHGGNIYSHQDKIIDFSANINPLGLSPLGVAACDKWTEYAIHYPEPNATGLKKALSDFYHIPTQHMIIGNGATELLYLLTRKIRPYRLVVPAPTFSEYERAVYGLRIPVVYCQYEELIHGNINIHPHDLICLGSPNNPDSAFLSKEEGLSLIKQIGKYHAHILIDESFIDFTDLYSFREEVARHPHVFVLHSLTKFWAIPGLRLGCLYAHDRLIQSLHIEKDIWNVNIMATLYLKEALKDHKYQARTKSFIATEKERLYNRYQACQAFNVVYPQANFLLLQANNYSAQMLTKQMAKRGYLIRNCDNYVGLDKNWFRIAIRSQSENDQLFQALSEEVGQ